MTDQTIRDGKLVSLTYSICDQAGNVLEQSDLPVSYIHGGRTGLIGGMDKAMAGKRAGDRVRFTLRSEQSVGSYDPSLTFTDAIDNVPLQFRHVGAEVPMQSEAGETKIFYVTKIENGQVTVDGNHPFAGKKLQVRIKIKEVRDPTERELGQDGLAQVAP